MREAHCQSLPVDQECFPWTAFIEGVGSLTWAADSSFLIYQPDHFTLKFVHSSSWTELLDLKSTNQRELHSITLSPDFRWLYATEGYEGHALLWNLEELRRRLREMSMGW
jgi:hypothetical protein